MLTQLVTSLSRSQRPSNIFHPGKVMPKDEMPEHLKFHLKQAEREGPFLSPLPLKSLRLAIGVLCFPFTFVQWVRVLLTPRGELSDILICSFFSEFIFYDRLFSILPHESQAKIISSWTSPRPSPSQSPSTSTSSRTRKGRSTSSWPR